MHNVYVCNNYFYSLTYIHMYVKVLQFINYENLNVYILVDI